MFELKILNRADTEKLLSMDAVIDVIDSVYRQKAEGKTAVFPLVFHEFRPGEADMDIKSGWLSGSGIFGLKLVSWYGGNPDKNLPALIGTILVCDDKTGAPIGLLDGSHITGMRTGAAGALGAKYLARPDSETLLLVGAGHVATFQVAATLHLFPGIKRVVVCDPLSFEGAQEFVRTIKDRVMGMGIAVPAETVFEATEQLSEAVGTADIIITVTPSKTPLIKKEWVRPGTHFSCIGADLAGKEEIDPQICVGARIFTDDTAQCINVGEIEIPVRDGIISPTDIAGEIGDIPTGKTNGRESADQITIFDATGTALLDLSVAHLAFAEAEKAGIGSSAEL